MTIWKKTTLGQILELKRGYDLPKSHRSHGPIPVISSSGPTDFHAEAKVDGPGVVTGRYGTIGQVFFSAGAFWPLNTALYVRDFKSNDPLFCYYFLKTLNWSKYNDKSGVPGVNRNDVHQEDVAIPEMEEQRQIAAILGALDDKIELNRRMSATLEEMARSLYRSWFVDFDPVQAKLEGRTPAHMDPATAALFPDSFGDNGLPKAWDDGTLDDLIKFNPTERLTKGGDAPYLDMKALPTGGMTHEKPIQRAFTSGTKFRQDDTLLARITPCLENGKTALVQNLKRGSVGWGSTEFIVMRPTGVVPKAYPYCVARSPEFRDVAIASMTGSSGRQRADAKRIGNIHAAVPPNDVFVEFASTTDPMLDKIEQMGAEIQTLATLRDTLLPKLMSGELRVGEAREQLEEVV